MPDPLAIYLAQLNLVVGDLTGNGEKITQAIRHGVKTKADVMVFPELAICGYPPEDLLLRPAFLKACREAITEMLPQTKGLTVLVGFPDYQEDDLGAGVGKLYNGVAVLQDGEWIDTYHKVELPNYGVFDEARYFTPGTTMGQVEVKGRSLGISVCEDVWVQGGAVEKWCLDAGHAAMLNLSASPFHAGKSRSRQVVLADFAKRSKTPLCYTNLIGGQDELVFDGGSMAFDAQGKLRVVAKRFEVDSLSFDLSAIDMPAVPTSSAETIELLTPHVDSSLDEEDEIYRALVLGVQDYVAKIGVKKVLIGLSGGIDSALVAALAVAAFGSENVIGVTMPSRYSSDDTLGDAHLLAKNLGIEIHEVAIEPMFKATLSEMDGVLGEGEPGIEQENLQARIRGNILMTLSNRHGWLVLTTGNKSEMAVGYCTLYGDMCGGYAVIKDVPKLMVFRLCRYINERVGRELIPVSTIDRPPSAELRADQKDEDSLPPYETLDAILQAYVEDDCGVTEIIDMGFDGAVVKDMIALVDRAEFKRRQAPLGVKITPKAFGRDRRMPIVNGFKVL